MRTGRDPRLLGWALVFVALVVAVVGSLGAPLITAVATTYGVSLSSAQWTLTSPLLVGAVTTPVLGRLGAGPRRRQVALGALGVVLAGGALTVWAPSFAWLVAGRAAQGVGLGLTALTIAVAREHLAGDRSRSTIALLSVASTVGIGLGYPTAGLLTDLAGVRAAYGLGLAITVLALVTAWRTVPHPPPGRTGTVDLVGAALFGAGATSFLLALTQTSHWRTAPILTTGLLVGSVLLFAAWAWWEHRTTHPLVDLALLRRPAIAGANLTMLLSGVGMYLLLTLVTRYVQTPASAGYGFGATVFVAGLVLVPLSALAFVGGRLTARLQSRLPAAGVLAAGAALVLVGLVWFALQRTPFWVPFAVLGLLGLGVGVFTAAMPSMILAVTPDSETSSAMSVNQVVRSLGFSVGSALAGFVLSSNGFPPESGYGVAAGIGVAIMAVTIVVSLLVHVRGR